MEYCRFFHIARGSARESGYLIDLSSRLGFLPFGVAERLSRRYDGLQAGLLRLTGTIEAENRDY